MKARESWTAAFVAALMFAVPSCSGDSPTGLNPPPPPRPPPPQTGTLDIRSVPPGAAITLNGSDAGQVTPATFTKAPGSYQVNITLDGYGDYTATVQVVAGQTAQVSVTLVPLAPLDGTLEVISNPANAVIFLNGVTTGKVTPWTFTKAPGLYRVGITLEGYEDYEQNVQVFANQPALVSAELTPIPSSEFYVGTVRNLLKGTIANDQVTMKIHRAIETGGLAIEGNIAVAYTTNGLEISRDNLTTWQIVGGCPNNLNPSGLGGKALPVPLTSTSPVEGWLVTGATGGFVYRYSESGCVPLRDRLPYQRGNFSEPGGVLDVVVNPDNPDEAWIFGEAAIYHTTNGGQNIEVQFRDLGADFWVGSRSGSRIYAGGILCDNACFADPNAKGQATVWRSDDDGQTWQEFSNGLPVGAFISIEIDPFNHNRLWVGHSGEGTWESTDGGQTWQQVSQNTWVGDLELIGDFLYEPNRRAEVGVWNWQLYNTFETGIVIAVAQ